MRLSKRKYDAVYESGLAQHSPLGVPIVGPPPHLSVPGPPPPPQLNGSLVPNGPSFHNHHHHHSPPSSSSTASPSGSIATQHRSPSSVVSRSAISPHHHHPSHPFDAHHTGHFHSKVSPNSASSHQQLQNSVEQQQQQNSPTEPVGHLPRSSPSSLLPPVPNSATYQPTHHSMFGQNTASFLHTGMSFYSPTYQAAAAAAAAAQLQQSSPTAPTGPWSLSACYPGVFSGNDHFGLFGAAAAASINSAASTTTNGAPKIWRSVDTDQLEAALSTTSEDAEVSNYDIDFNAVNRLITCCLLLIIFHSNIIRIHHFFFIFL